jgi:hypothetical protein
LFRIRAQARRLGKLLFLVAQSWDSAFWGKEKAVAVNGELVQMGLIEYRVLTSSGAIGSLLVYGYQNWLKK